MRTLTPLLTLLAALAVTTPAADAGPLAEHVPADAIVYVGFDGATSDAADLDQRHLGRLLEHTQLRELIVETLPDAMRRFAEIEHEPGLSFAAEAVADLAPVLIDRPWAFYFAGLDEMAMMPRLGLLIDAGPQRDAVQAWIEQLTQMGAPVQQIDHEDYIGAVLDFTFAEPEDGGLAASDHFEGATAPLPGPHVALAYVNVDRIVNMIFEQMRQMPPGLAGGPQPDEIEAALTAAGLDSLQTVAWSASFDGPRWRTDAFIQAPAPRQGLIAWLIDGEPITLDDLAPIPATASWLFAGRFDLLGLYEAVGQAVRDIDPEAWHEVQGGLAMMGMMLGVDLENELIAALGPAWIAWRDADVAGPASVFGLVVSNELRQPQRLASALDMLTRSANAATEPHWEDDPHFRFVAADHRGTDVHSFAFLFVQPSFAIHDGRLYIGLLPQAVTHAIDFAIDGGESITANERFTAMRDSLGEADVLTRGWTDLAPAAETVYGEMLMVGQMLPGILIAMDHHADAAALHRLPTLSQIRDLLEPAGRITWASDAGLHMRHITPFPGAAALGHEGGSGMMFAPVGVGITLPALAAARTTARQMQSGTHLRQIMMGLHMYAMDHDDSAPDDIAILYADIFEDPLIFISPAADISAPQEFHAQSAQERAQWIREHSSYVLIPLGELAQIPRPSQHIAAFERPEHAAGDDIVVGFADGHVQRLSIHEARQLIEEQTGQTLEELYERQATYGQE